MALQPRQQGVSQQVVHGPGLTLVRHAPRGSGLDVLFTGGDDYIVRVLNTRPGEDSVSIALEDATAQISWLDAGIATLITGAEDGCVRVYALPYPPAEGGEAIPSDVWAMQKLLTRTPLPVRAIALEIAPEQRLPQENPDSVRRVAVVSDDLVVRVISLADPLDSIVLAGHERAVRTASWSPIAPILVTASCDGTVRIWDLSSDALAAAGPGGPAAMQVIKDVLPVTAVGYTERAIYALWHPSGRFFVLPSKTNELLVFGRNSVNGQWERKRVFNGPPQNGVTPPIGPISALAFSFNGRYLATATTGNGQLTVWDTATLSPIARKTSESDAVSISWAVDRDALAWADMGGQLYRWEDVLPPTCSKPGFEAIAGIVPPSLLVSRFGGNEEEGEANTARSGGGGPHTARREFPTEDDLDHTLDAFRTDDFEEAGSAGGLPARSRRRRHYEEEESDSGSESEASVLPSRLARLLGRGQKSLQPTSTPPRNGRRFLAFNTVGTLMAVEQTNVDGERTGQTINFESFNTSARRNWRLTETGEGFSLGALNEQGAVFSSKPSSTEDSGSIFFKPFDLGWSPSSEWRVSLPTGVKATCLALGGFKRKPNSDLDDEDLDLSEAAATVIIASTSDGFVRIFSRAGLQRAIWSVGGRVVALAAGTYTGMIVTAPPVSFGGYQDLSYELFDLQSFTPMGAGKIPLARGAELRWTGLNDLDAPAVWDSHGVLSMLASPRSHYWVPVLDVRTMDEADQSDVLYWPTEVTWKAMVTLVLKGARTSYPDPSAPTPLIHELPLRIPVLTTVGTEEAKHEETFLRLMLASTQARTQPAQAPKNKDARPDTLAGEADRALLQTLQAACKASDQNKALDAARELNMPRSVVAAAQIAAYFGMTSLAEQIRDLKPIIAARSEARTELSSESGGTIVIAPTIQRTVGSSSDHQSAVARAKKALTQDFTPDTLTRRSKFTPVPTGRREDTMTPLPSSSSRSGSLAPPPSSSLRPSQPESLSVEEEIAALRNQMQDEDMAAEEAMREESDEGRKRKAPDDEQMMPPPLPAEKGACFILSCPVKCVIVACFFLS